MATYVVRESESGKVFTVGFYGPLDQQWNPESDHSDSEAAARRVHYLNGGAPIIPEFNEVNPNPATSLDLQLRDGVTLRFRLPQVQQARMMAAIGQLHGQLGVELDLAPLLEPGPATEALEGVVAAAQALFDDYDQSQVMNCPFCLEPKPEHVDGCVFFVLMAMVDRVAEVAGG